MSVIFREEIHCQSVVKRRFLQELKILFPLLNELVKFRLGLLCILFRFLKRQHGSTFLIQWNDPREEVASPGAMDDATGVALKEAPANPYNLFRAFTEAGLISDERQVAQDV